VKAGWTSRIIVAGDQAAFQSERWNMQVVLVMFTSEGQRRSFSLPKSTTIIGRREDCDVRIPLGEVSRKHCRLTADGDELRVEDMGSSNGTFLNGVRVQEAAIQPGDSLQIGPIAFAVQINGVPADDEIQPPTPADDASDTRAGAAMPAAPGDAADAAMGALGEPEDSAAGQPLNLDDLDIDADKKE
jgi:predicted component of type VI protein secretion system